jgi:hypothetical protein
MGGFDMPKRAKAAIMILVTMMLLSACTGIADTQVDIQAVQSRLQQMDAYKQSINKQTQQAYSTGDATFRGFSFGTSKELISAMETLPLSEQFTDALDYTGSSLYGYDMLLTYWFNSDEQFYGASYNMQNDVYLDTVNTLTAGLHGDFGEPVEAGYYNDTDIALTFDSEDKAMQALEKGDAYYYDAFVDANGIKVELFARRYDNSYDYWVYYTDYTYYTG